MSSFALQAQCPSSPFLGDRCQEDLVQWIQFHLQSVSEFGYFSFSLDQLSGDGLQDTYKHRVVFRWFEKEKLVGLRVRVCLINGVHLTNCMATAHAPKEPKAATMQLLISVQTKSSLLNLAGRFRKDMKTISVKTQYL